MARLSLPQIRRRRTVMVLVMVKRVVPSRGAAWGFDCNGFRTALFDALQRRRSLLLSLPGVLLEPFAGTDQVGLIHDVVPVEDGTRAVAADLHGHSVPHASALHVAHRGSPQIMEE